MRRHIRTRYKRAPPAPPLITNIGRRSVTPTKAKAKHARKSLWTPKKLTPADVTNGDAWCKLWRPKPNAAQKVWDKYVHFCSLNDLHVNDGVKAWIGQVAPIYKPSTLRNYLAWILQKGKTLPDKRMWLKAASMASADAGMGKAPDVPLRTLWTYITSIEDVACQGAAFLMLVTGARLMDLRRLRRSQISVEVGRDRLPKFPDLRFKQISRMVVDWRVTKSRRDPKSRIKTYIPIPWITKFSEIPISILNFLNEGNAEEKIVKDITVNQMNSLFRTLSTELGIPRVTTYSFRRWLVNEADDYCGGDDHSTIRITGHKNPASIGAFYKK
jgi:integrase